MIGTISTIAAIGSCISAIAAVVVALYVNWDSKRPYVVCYLEHDSDHGVMNIIVENQGESTARTIELKGFDLDMVTQDFRDHINRSFVVRGIPVLVPGAKRVTAILVAQDTKDHVDDATNVGIAYTGRGILGKTKKFEDEFILDYYSFSGSLFTDSDLHAIKKDCDVMAKAIKQSSQEIQSLAKALRSTYEQS